MSALATIEITEREWARLGPGRGEALRKLKATSRDFD